MIWPIAPLTTSHNLQSSVFVPTMMSTCLPEPAAIRSIGGPGTIWPSMTGCHGIVLVTTDWPHRSGSGSVSRSAFSSACAASRR